MDYRKFLATKLKNIRQNTNLNQTDFFEKYLLNVSDVPTRGGNVKPSKETMQGRMRDYENGVRSLPAEALPVLADLAGCSVSDLFGNERNYVVKKEWNIGDVIRMLFSLDEIEPVCVTEERIVAFGDLDFRPCITFSAEWTKLNDILSSWANLQKAGIDESLKEEVMQTWKAGVIAKYGDMDIQESDVQP